MTVSLLQMFSTAKDEYHHHRRGRHHQHNRHHLPDLGFLTCSDHRLRRTDPSIS
jgi:carbonic anhydrase